MPLFMLAANAVTANHSVMSCQLQVTPCWPAQVLASDLIETDGQLMPQLLACQMLPRPANNARGPDPGSPCLRSCVHNVVHLVSCSSPSCYPCMAPNTCYAGRLPAPAAFEIRRATCAWLWGQGCTQKPAKGVERGLERQPESSANVFVVHKGKLLRRRTLITMT